MLARSWPFGSGRFFCAGVGDKRQWRRRRRGCSSLDHSQSVGLKSQVVAMGSVARRLLLGAFTKVDGALSFAAHC